MRYQIIRFRPQVARNFFIFILTLSFKLYFIFIFISCLFYFILYTYGYLWKLYRIILYD